MRKICKGRHTACVRHLMTCVRKFVHDSSIAGLERMGDALLGEL